MYCRNAKKCRDKVASQEKEVDGTQQNIEHLRQELKNLEDQALQLLEKHKQLVVCFVFVCLHTHFKALFISLDKDTNRR